MVDPAAQVAYIVGGHDDRGQILSTCAGPTPRLYALTPRRNRLPSAFYISLTDIGRALLHHPRTRAPADTQRGPSLLDLTFCRIRAFTELHGLL